MRSLRRHDVPAALPLRAVLLQAVLPLLEARPLLVVRPEPVAPVHGAPGRPPIPV